MAGETEERPSGWTVDTLHAHIRQRLSDMDTRLDERHGAQKEAVSAALLSAKEAVDKAERAANLRADAQNEFRGQLKDQAATFIGRDEFSAAIGRLTERIGALESSKDTLAGGRVAIASGFALLLVVIPVVVVVANLLTGR